MWPTFRSEQCWVKSCQMARCKSASWVSFKQEPHEGSCYSLLGCGLVHVLGVGQNMFLGTISTQRLWSQLKDCDLNSKIVFFSVLCVGVCDSLQVITLWNSHTLPTANCLQLSLKAWKMLRQLRPKLPWTQHAGLARWFLLSSEEERQWANI